MLTARAGCWRPLVNGTLMARKVNDGSAAGASRQWMGALTCVFVSQRGDGNRTGTISLGIGQITARYVGDQAAQEIWSSRD